jgi:3',5'-cyclic AMP phosphodiesterase CpdA
MTTTLLHLSDPHFGTERPEVVDGLLRFAHALAPDVVVLSGDITQRATARQFAAARAFCERLPRAPLLAIPGNHDIPLFDLATRLLRPYARYRAAFGDDLEPAWACADMRIAALNTTRPWRHQDGEVSAEQVEQVASRSAGAPSSQWRVAVVHQPVAALVAQDRANVLHGHAAAIRRWSAAGVDLVLGGHIHLPYVLALHERDRTLPRPIWAVQAGTAVSSRVRHEADNSVNVVRTLDAARGRRCRVERWDWSAPRAAFERSASHDLSTGAD